MATGSAVELASSSRPVSPVTSASSTSPAGPPVAGPRGPGWRGRCHHRTVGPSRCEGREVAVVLSGLVGSRVGGLPEAEKGLRGVGPGCVVGIQVHKGGEEAALVRPILTLVAASVPFDVRRCAVVIGIRIRQIGEEAASSDPSAALSCSSTSSAKNDSPCHLLGGVHLGVGRGLAGVEVVASSTICQRGREGQAGGEAAIEDAHGSFSQADRSREVRGRSRTMQRSRQRN